MDGSIVSPMASQFERLNQLHKLANAMRPGQQSEWSTCLWNEARHDQLLIDMGFPAAHYGSPCGLYDMLGKFFGVNETELCFIFSAEGIERKRAYIEDIIRTKQLTTQSQEMEIVHK
jgi:hypothetical protein